MTAKPAGDEAAGASALNRRLALFPMTDLGNAERFRERNRGRFLQTSSAMAGHGGMVSGGAARGLASASYARPIKR